ncbi:MAG TPA: hypothetical protein VLF95_02185 [Vicinamibacteria bacterium]|nr:hypothetical protein [Vicinamibacteria bacterium]
MRRRDFVRAATAALPLARAAAADREPPFARGPDGAEPLVATLALHYMTWLQQGSWPSASTWPVLHDPAYPLPRGYDSDDPVVFRAHNRAAERHGFAWLWSWWGREGVAGGDATLRRYLDLDPEATVPLLILHESTGILSAGRDGLFDFGDAANFRRFVDDVAYLDRVYWSSSRYAHRFLRVDGRPVLFAWVSRNFTGAWAAAVAAARREASFYLVGSEFLLDLTPDGRPLVRADLAEALSPLDAVSGYGIYDPRYVPASGRLDAAYASRYDQALRGWAEVVTTIAPHASFVPPLQFAFDDHYYRPGARNPPLRSSVEEAIAVARVTRRLLDDARAGDARYRSVLPLAFLASWNEHLEGSAVEWTDEHGYGYVMAAARAFR